MPDNRTQGTLSIFSVIDALRRRKFFIIIPALLLTVGFSLYAYLQPARYRATALIAAGQTTPPEYLRHVAPPPLQIEDHLWIVREVLFSQPVLEEAAKELKHYKNVQGNASTEPVDELRAGISLKVENEHTFQLTFDTTDRYEAMNVTNKLSELFVQRASADRNQKNQDAATVIDDQLNSLKQRLEGQSQELHAYKQRAVNALPDHIDDNIHAMTSLKADYQERTTKIAEEEARRTTIQKQIAELEEKGLLEEKPVVEEKSPDETKLDELRIKQQELIARYTPKHPEVIQLQRTIRDLEKTVALQPRKSIRSEPSTTYLHYVELKAELDGINQRIAAYRQDQQEISGQMATYNQRIQSTPEHERVIEDLQRELQVGESQFHALLDKRLDASMAKDLAQSGSGIAFTIVEPASLPIAPFSPQRERIVLMGLFAGLGLGLALAFLLEQNDTSFGNVDDFQAFTTLPAIGVIPNVFGKKRQKKDSKAPIVSWTDPDSIAAEQYRVLAMKLQQQCESQNSNIVMITSAAGGEGKSLTAINLAVALAATAEKSVLLVDADMRKPSIHEYLNLAQAAKGGFPVLLARPDDELEKYIHKIKGLDVISGAIPSANPVAVLAAPRTRALFERFRKNYAFTIIDAPPTLPIADSHILSGLSDKVMFVVRARQTPRELFQHALESFETGNLLGAVLNDVDYERSRYAYAYEYYKKVAA